MNPSQRKQRRAVVREGRRFDVQPSNDDRALNYPVSAILESTPVEPVRKTWRRGLTLDQGQEGACVGHGWTHEMTGSPKRVPFGVGATPGDAPDDAQDFAFWLYAQAQKVDQWPGEDYSGTSIDAAAGIVRDLGFIEDWWWIEDREDLVQVLTEVGPVLIAVPWFSGMYATDGNEIAVSGSQVGWHCLLVNGYDPARVGADGLERESIRLHNSWGPGWGHGGHAWIGLDEAWRRLLSIDGAEMCVPRGRVRRVAD